MKRIQLSFEQLVDAGGALMVAPLRLHEQKGTGHDMEASPEWLYRRPSAIMIDVSDL